jgi:hypothetical protein
MIPAYHICNILKALTKSLVNGGPEVSPKGMVSAHAHMDFEGRRHTVAQRVSRAVLEKISKMGGGHLTGKAVRIADDPYPESVGDAATQFTYTSVDENGKKRTITRAVK